MRRQRETWSGVIYEEGRVAAGIDHILIHQTHSFSPAVFVFSLHQALFISLALSTAAVVFISLPLSHM